MKINNKKGIALIMVAVVIAVAVPMIYILLNLSSSQKEQALSFDSAFTVEQTVQSGINYGHYKLRGGHKDYESLNGEILGQNRFNLNITPTGKGFFLQDIYLLISHASDKKNRHSSIIMADAEQFKSFGKISNLAITHDYWVTNEPYNISLKADVLGIKNSRGQDQLRNLDIKKFEMQNSKEDFREAISSLGEDLPESIKEIWQEVTKAMVGEKINWDGVIDK